MYWLYGSFSCSTTSVHRGLYLMGMFFVFLTNAIIGDFSVMELLFGDIFVCHWSCADFEDISL